MADWSIVDAPATRDDIIAAYRLVLGRTPDQAGLEHFLDMAETGRLTVGQSLGEFTASLEHRITRRLFQARTARLSGRPEEALNLAAEALAIEPNFEQARIEAIAARSQMNEATRRAIAAEKGVSSEDLPRELTSVAIGTTAVCNASCIHCPTGKAETDHVPRTPMVMPLFEKIINGIASLNLAVTGNLNLGLFGDGLLDPHVVERVRFIRTRMPEIRVSVNTNGAAYDRKKHGALRDLTSIITLHVESLVPETYNQLMQPLRAERVFPKLDAVLRDFPGQVDISVPVSRLNAGELAAIRAHFMDRGARLVHFDPLISRSALDLSAFQALAIAPSRHRCCRAILEHLVVDCDGTVLMCCNDFRRAEPIGDLARQSLLEVLLGAARSKAREQLDQMRHDEIAPCSRCYADARDVETWQALVPA